MSETYLDPNPVIAIAISDIHLSHKPPSSRSCEDNWYEAMKRSLYQVKKLQKKHLCPVIIAGDIFDDGWRMNKCPPSLINFAIAELPDKIYAIPGQHDLPNHRYDEIERSAYWTLVEAGKIKDIDPSHPECIGGVQPIRLCGFPWGFEVTPCVDSHDMYLEIAVIHSYIWVKGKGYQGAPEDKLASKWKNKLKGYDIAIVGDNHHPFRVSKEKAGIEIYNCGTLMKRKLDERNFSIGIGLLRRNGEVTRVELSTNKEKWIDKDSIIPDIMNARDLVNELNNLSDTSVSFTEALERAMEENKVNNEVRSWILKALEDR